MWLLQHRPALFDSFWYQKEHKLKSRLHAYWHYTINDRRFDPSPIFDINGYLILNKDIAIGSKLILRDVYQNYCKVFDRPINKLSFTLGGALVRFSENIPSLYTVTTKYITPRVQKKKSGLIILPFFNNYHYLIRCINSLLGSNSFQNFDLVLIDDSSTEKMPKFVREKINFFNVVKNRENLGYLRSVNMAIEIYKFDYDFFLILNSDVEVLGNSINDLLNLMSSNSNLGIVSPYIFSGHGQLIETQCKLFLNGEAYQINNKVGFDQKFESSKVFVESDYVSGACMLLSKQIVLDAIDVNGALFDDRFAPAYYEDVDLSLFAYSRQYRIGYYGKSKVVHHEGKTHGTDESQGIKKYQGINKIKLSAKWEKELVKRFANKSDYVVDGVQPGILTCSGSKILIFVDDRYPHEFYGGGEARASRFIYNYLNQGYHVSILTTKNVSVGFEDELRNSICGVDHVSQIEHFVNYFNLEIHSKKEIVIHIARLDNLLFYANLVKSFIKCKLIFDTVDLFHYLDEKFFDIRTLKSLTQVLEKIIVVNDKEKEYFLRELDTPESKIQIIADFRQNTVEKPANQRQGIVLMGSLNHPPNQKMIEIFFKQIYPNIENILYNEPIYIVGRGWNKSKLKELWANNPKIIFLESVPNLHEQLSKFKLACAPLTSGEGIKIKTLDCMIAGTPVIGTKYAFSGLDTFSLAKYGNVELEDISHALISAYINTDVWERLNRIQREIYQRQRSILEKWEPIL